MASFDSEWGQRYLHQHGRLSDDVIKKLADINKWLYTNGTKLSFTLFLWLLVVVVIGKRMDNFLTLFLCWKLMLLLAMGH